MASSLTPEQIDKLVSLAGQRLGTTPEALKSLFQQQGLAGLVSLTDKGNRTLLSPDEAATASQLLQNKGKAEQLLNDPRIQSVLQKILDNQ